MFGYIQPHKDELRFREFAEYRAYYCGLCKCMGRRFGEHARAALSYDCTFVALLLCGMAGHEAAHKCRCLYKPLERVRMAAEEDEYLRFAADMNILLYYCKLEDDWRDERRPAALAGRGIISGAAKKAREHNPGLFSAISSGIAELSTLERENTAELDAPADAFARMMRSIGECAPAEGQGNRIAFPRLLYHLGRWVYLIDAWEDRDKDREKGAYNPFLRAGADKERAAFLLNRSLEEAINAYDLLEIRAHCSLLDNIMLEGCPGRNIQALGGKDE